MSFTLTHVGVDLKAVTSRGLGDRLQVRWDAVRHGMLVRRHGALHAASQWRQVRHAVSWQQRAVLRWFPARVRLPHRHWWWEITAPISMLVWKCLITFKSDSCIKLVYWSNLKSVIEPFGNCGFVVWRNLWCVHAVMHANLHNCICTCKCILSLSSKGLWLSCCDRKNLS